MMGLQPMPSGEAFDPISHGPAGMRTFLNIASHWRLSKHEQLKILGISNARLYERWKEEVQRHDDVELPMDVVVRIGCVLSIYASLVTLFDHERTEKWLRAPMIHREATGESALDYMVSGDINKLRKVVSILLGNIWG